MGERAGSTFGGALNSAWLAAEDKANFKKLVREQESKAFNETKQKTEIHENENCRPINSAQNQNLKLENKSLISNNYGWIAKFNHFIEWVIEIFWTHTFY